MRPTNGMMIQKTKYTKKRVSQTGAGFTPKRVKTDDVKKRINERFS